MDMVLKNRVYDLRSKAVMTQSEFAERAGVTRQTIIAIEKGNYTPSVALALKIAKVFKRPVEEIFYLT